MKINFIIEGIFKSGGMKILVDYANLLTENKHQVKFFYPAVPYNRYKEKIYFKHIFKQFKEKLGFYAKGRYRLDDYYRCNFTVKNVLKISNKYIPDADAVIATSWPTSYSVAKLNGNKGKKFYFIQGIEYWDSDINAVNESYRLDLIKISVSEFLQNFLLKNFNEKSILIRNGIDTSVYSNSNKIYNKEKVLSFVNYGSEKKNTKIALQVAERIKEEYRNVKIISFGLKEFHKLPEYICFIENPVESEIINIYRKSDIFLFASDEEGFGLPPAEAMACKCAVVTTKVGAIGEFSEHLVSAFHTEPGDLDSLYKGVKYFLDNENELKRISENAELKIKTDLNQRDSFDKLLNLLKNS